jgi:hypothetical protein
LLRCVVLSPHVYSNVYKMQNSDAHTLAHGNQSLRKPVSQGTKEGVVNLVSPCRVFGIARLVSL